MFYWVWLPHYAIYLKPFWLFLRKIPNFGTPNFRMWMRKIWVICWYQNLKKFEVSGGGGFKKVIWSRTFKDSLRIFLPHPKLKNVLFPFYPLKFWYWYWYREGALKLWFNSASFKKKSWSEWGDTRIISLQEGISHVRGHLSNFNLIMS